MRPSLFPQFSVSVLLCLCVSVSLQSSELNCLCKYLSPIVKVTACTALTLTGDVLNLKFVISPLPLTPLVKAAQNYSFTAAAKQIVSGSLDEGGSTQSSVFY